MSRYLRRNYCGTKKNFVFVGPCHVLPGEYSRQCIDGSHLDIRQLTCQPNLPTKDFLHDFVKTNEVTEFDKNPKAFLDDILHDNYYGVLMFDNQFDEIMEMHDYKLKEKFFHSHFSDQGQFIYLYTQQ